MLPNTLPLSWSLRHPFLWEAKTRQSPSPGSAPYACIYTRILLETAGVPAPSYVPCTKACTQHAAGGCLFGDLPFWPKGTT